MTFTDEPDTEYLFLRRVDSTGLVEFGVYRVIFGYRVRAGFVGEMSVVLDWCAGSEIAVLAMLYALCQTILESREANRSCFEGVPSVSRVKPFFNDPDFTEKLTKIGDTSRTDPVILPAGFAKILLTH